MAITGSTDLGDGLRQLTVNQDPRTYPVDCPAGSVIVYGGVHYQKLDDGSTTNVSQAPTAVDHKILRQLIHFINTGPAEGFASGAYREVTGTVFPSAVIWYDKAGAGKKKIVEKTLAYTGAFPTTIVWKIYDEAETLLATVTDVITYSGNFETSRLRTIA